MINIEIPNRTHTPDLEPRAWNQMPKAGVRDLRLFQFDGTNLYAWWGKNGTDPSKPGYSVFEDMLTEPFCISVNPPLSQNLEELINNEWVSLCGFANPANISYEEFANAVHNVLRKL
jgi:hypothetical protein